LPVILAVSSSWKHPAGKWISFYEIRPSDFLGKPFSDVIRRQKHTFFAQNSAFFGVKTSNLRTIALVPWRLQRTSTAKASPFFTSRCRPANSLTCQLALTRLAPLKKFPPQFTGNFALFVILKLSTGKTHRNSPESGVVF
jgi:hypothetical protein